MSVVDRLGRSATATALEDCVLFWMTRPQFWDCLHSIPAMTYNAVLQLSAPRATRHSRGRGERQSIWRSTASERAQGYGR